MTGLAAIRAAFVRVWALRRSMLLQMALLTVLFVGWGFYSFALRPILDIPDIQNRDPLSPTVDAVRATLLAQVHAEQARPGSLARLSGDPVLRQVASRNPDFRYHVRVEDRSGGNGAASDTYSRLHLAELTRLLGRNGSSDLCAQMSKPAETPEGRSYQTYMGCGRPYYFEYSGLRVPLPDRPPDVIGLWERRLWSYSAGFLIAAGGVFAIFAVVLAANMILIGRVARLAASIDPEEPDVQLPEQGLASEVLPLVRAVNAMTARIDQVRQRNGFFMSAAAHEMRTPLTVLRTRMELLDDSVIKSKLIGDVRRLIELVNQLLALTSIGARSVRNDEVDLGVCCHKVAEDIDAAAADRALKVSVVAEPGAYRLSGDAALIESALVNLMRNAISFAPPGTQVDLRLDTAGAVTVRDRGPGIPDDRLGSVFEPFVRFPANRRGHGLGLAIVRAIATLHGGSVTANHAPGGGALFTIRFDTVR